LQTRWMVPSRAFHRVVAGFRFDKAHGFDVMEFRGKHAATEWVDGQLVTRVQHFTLWDLLASAFRPGDASACDDDRHPA
ncbi:MAG: hypothetical protein JW839_14580, partial [Candidatus Lokiarchaeota archaeon]|nr:hypothetical protein [Candidatus Lokiarchaeota archaeon]